MYIRFQYGMRTTSQRQNHVIEIINDNEQCDTHDTVAQSYWSRQDELMTITAQNKDHTASPPVLFTMNIEQALHYCAVIPYSLPKSKLRLRLKAVIEISDEQGECRKKNTFIKCTVTNKQH